MTGEKKTLRYKQYSIWLRLVAKRIWKQPVYILLLVLIPVLGYVLGRMQQDQAGGVSVAVYIEEGTWSGELSDGLREQETDSVLRFDFCADEMEVERRVMKSDADCGFIIKSDLAERVRDKDWRKAITVYETENSSITGMAKERIGSVVFRLYSEQCYEDYMRETTADMRKDKAPQETLAGGNSMGQQEGEAAEERERAHQADDMAEFALEAYERHLADGSTFGFRYLYDDQSSQDSSDMSVVNDTVVFPVKGVFAVIIFISGMCGMLEYDRDRQEKRFYRIAPNILTCIVDIWMPTVFLSAAVLICLWIFDGIRACGQEISLGGILTVWSAGAWGRQIGSLLLYQCVVVVYCCILRLMFRRQETVAAAIPVLSLGSLVCAPVFVRLAAYIPVFTVLEKLFPPTYYLMW